ncbi:MAG: 2-hydroxyacid dehydrogenase [Geminicoccaceae bacterium]
MTKPKVVIQSTWPETGDWLEAFRTQAPDLDVTIWPDVGAPEAVSAAVVWFPPQEMLDAMPALRVLCSLGAGVDHIIARDLRLPDVPITRLVDPLMSQRVSHYVLSAVCRHHRMLDVYQRDQIAGRWQPQAHKDTHAFVVGVLGLGEIGTTCAQLLRAAGYPVLGWSRSPKIVDGVETYAGPEGLRACLARIDALVSLLPLTRETRGLIDRDLLSRMPKGGYVINAGRGDQVVLDDLIAALDSGQLSGASLDVLPQEPLPADHPLWHRDDVLITPHIAGLSNPVTGARVIIEQIRSALAGRTPAHTVDRARGY